jgi:hypothetical protein
LSTTIVQDVRLAARQQRIADELREECRYWSVPFDADSGLYAYSSLLE